MDEYLIDLITRMNDTGDQKLNSGYDSSKSISWKAFREAEELQNSDFIPQLMDYIDNEKNRKNREQAYFILGHLAKNTKENSATQYLIERIDKETDKYVISTLLDRISELNKPSGTDIKAIINATKHNKWLIRHSAIQALKNSNDELAELTLIDILEQSEDPYDLTYANSTLIRVGTLKAIPHIEKHLTSKKRDVRITAKYAIEEIKKRNE